MGHFFYLQKLILFEEYAETFPCKFASILLAVEKKLVEEPLQETVQLCF